MATGKMTEQASQWLLNTQLENSAQTITLSTAKKYIKKDIKIDITTQAAQTATNITTASSGGVPLISTAGYIETNNLTAVTIDAGETLGSASAAGVTLSANDSSNNISQMYVTMNTGSKMYVTDANSGKTWIIESDSINNSLNIWQE